MSPVLRVLTHIYGVSKDIDGKTSILRVNLGMWPLKSIALEKNPVLRVSFLFFKAHTIKWQIYPGEVFYAKDLLPVRVTI